MKPVITLSAVVASLVLAAALAGAGRAGSAQPAASQASSEKSPERPRVIAIKFHADWCGYCKAMGPVFEELQAKYDQQPVLYVEFDQTRDFGRRQSAFMASALGLDAVWAEHGGKTGFVLLIDAETGRVVERLSHEQDLKQMGAALLSAAE